jgi:hypothetical protein
MLVEPCALRQHGKRTWNSIGGVSGVLRHRPLVGAILVVARFWHRVARTGSRLIVGRTADDHKGRPYIIDSILSK